MVHFDERVYRNENTTEKARYLCFTIADNVREVTSYELVVTFHDVFSILSVTLPTRDHIKTDRKLTQNKPNLFIWINQGTWGSAVGVPPLVGTKHAKKSKIPMIIGWQHISLSTPPFLFSCRKYS